MASLRGVSRSARALPLSQSLRQAPPACVQQRRSNASAAAAELQELEGNSTLGVPELSPEDKSQFRPWKRAKDRQLNLPGSRYQYHPPKYTRGPLNPIQSPLSSDPIARDFVPGPFNNPRLKQTYRSTISSDLMTLAYNHIPPGTPEKEHAERLRSWEGDSPYFENRARRAPRGSPQLMVREKGITFRNIPELTQISVATFVPKASDDPDFLLVARMAILAITGVIPEVTKSKTDMQAFGIRKGEKLGIKTTLYGHQAYEFLDRCLNIVFPRIKEWKGIKASTGDSAGNLAFGLRPEDLALFPEIQTNYDNYPTKMIPGCRIFLKTTATSDRQARLLMQSMGVPFYGTIKD